MGILQDLVTKLQGFQETTNCEPATENSQEESDLFLEINQSSTVETNKQQVWKKFSFYNDFYLMEPFFFAGTLTSVIKLNCTMFRMTEFNVAPSVFRSFFLHLAPSSSIHVWSSGFWLWSWPRCLLTH